jgi:hypothetical protein
MLIKRITVGLWGFAIAGILIMGCEKMDGPDPYIDKHVYDQFLLISKADGQPLGAAIPLDKDSLKLVINDAAVLATFSDTITESITDTITNTITNTIKNTTVSLPLSISTVGKIIFQKKP